MQLPYKDPQKQREYCRRYKQKHRSEIREKNFKYNLIRNHGKTGLTIWKRDKGVCRKCGNGRGNGNQIVIHHINWDETDNRLENLILLCKKCHQHIHNYTRVTMTIPKEHVLKSWRQWYDD